MMRSVDLNKRTLTEVDIGFMELDEINQVLEEVQSEIFKAAKEKKTLTTLPRCKKDIKSMRKVNKLSKRLMDLQEAQCWIGRIRKQKRDTMQKEKRWYRAFYSLTKDTVRKSVLEKLIQQTNEKMDYAINL
jgi:hypothetical protein